MKSLVAKVKGGLGLTELWLCQPGWRETRVLIFFNQWWATNPFSSLNEETHFLSSLHLICFKCVRLFWIVCSEFAKLLRRRWGSVGAEFGQLLCTVAAREESSAGVKSATPQASSHSQRVNNLIRNPLPHTSPHIHRCVICSSCLSTLHSPHSCLHVLLTNPL